jgi:hypothetical protein
MLAEKSLLVVGRQTRVVLKLDQHHGPCDGARN